MDRKFNPIQKTGIFLLLLISATCSPRLKVKEFSASVIELNAMQTADVDSQIVMQIAPYRDSLSTIMNGVLAQSGQIMDTATPEGLLGNFIADLILKKADEYYYPPDNRRIDFCVLNNDGLRTALPKGAITKGKVFEIMPFENEIVVVTLTGEKTKELFDFIAKAKGMPVSGVTLGIRNESAVEVNIGREKFNPADEYKIVTSDYLAKGGLNMIFFRNLINIEYVGKKVRDAIIEFMVEENNHGRALNSSVDGRIYFAK